MEREDFQNKMNQLVELAKTQKNALDIQEVKEILGPEMDLKTEVEAFSYLQDKKIRILCDDSMVYNLFEDSDEMDELEDDSDEEDDSNPGDFVSDIQSVTPDENEESRIQKYFDILLCKLNDWERQVIIRRFGLLDGKPRTREEVAEEFNTTSERIRLIEHKTLRGQCIRVTNKKIRDFLN